MPTGAVVFIAFLFATGGDVLAAIIGLLIAYLVIGAVRWLIRETPSIPTQ